jgi:hypothetical protein
MNYWVIVLNRHGEPYHYFGGFLPGFINPDLVEHTSCDWAEKLKFCDRCSSDGAVCHVIRSDGRKYCPVLFHDLVSTFIKVPWTPKQLV